MKKELSVNDLVVILENHFKSTVIIDTVDVNEPNKKQFDTTKFNVGPGHACTITIDLNDFDCDEHKLNSIEEKECVEDFVVDRVNDLEKCVIHEEKEFNNLIVIEHVHINDKNYFPLGLGIDVTTTIKEDTQRICGEIKEFFEDLKNNKR